jgi:hypothetical protein
VCLRRASLADPAPIVDVEDLVQPFRGCFIQLQFGSPIEPGKLIDGPNADNCGSDRRVLEDPGGRDDVLGFPEVATKLEKSRNWRFSGPIRIPYSAST